MGWFSWHIIIAIVWAAFALVVWLDPRDKMPKALTITLMILLALDSFFEALEKAYS